VNGVQAERCDSALRFLAQARSRREAEHVYATIGFTPGEHEVLFDKDE
jgi:hypothetical protein